MNDYRQDAACGYAGAPPPPMGQAPYYPPSGTYPAPYEQPIYNTEPPPPPENAKKTRRVGTITMGICLVAVGVILILAIFVPVVDVIYLARFAPLVLVLLGVEILIAHVRHQDKKIRYDALSVIICVILIGCSLFAATVPVFVQQVVDARRGERRLATELQEKSYDALAALPDAEQWTVDWSVSLYETENNDGITAANLDKSRYVSVSLLTENSFEDASAFAKACREAAEKLDGLVPRLNHAWFSNGEGFYTGDMCYSVEMDGRQLFNASAEDIEKHILTQYWVDEGYYVSEWEYRDRLANPENYGLVPEDFYDPEVFYDPEYEDGMSPLSAAAPVLKNRRLSDASGGFPVSAAA